MIVSIDESVRRDMKKIKKANLTIALRINLFLDETLTNAQDPRRIPGTKKLQDYENFYRWRIGNYRVVARFYEDLIEICEVVLVADRKEVYERLKRKDY